MVPKLSSWSKRLYSFEGRFFTYIENFILIKETKKAVYLKLSNNLNIWFPKSCIRNFYGTSAYVLHTIYRNNIFKEKEKQRLKFLKLNFPHNAAIAREFTYDDIKKLEKELDAKME